MKRRLKESVKNFILLFFVLIFLLSMLELLWRYEIVPEPYSDDMNVNYERQWRYFHINLKNKITIQPYNKFHSLLGWTLKENINNTIEEITINSQGIRSKKEFSLEKTNKTRILLLGDSFTFGECLKDNQSFASLLERDNIEILNMGVIGYGNDQQLIKLKEDGLKYNPDIIILGYFYENLERNTLTFYSYSKPKFIIENSKLKLINSPIKKPEYYSNKLLLIENFKLLFKKLFLSSKKPLEENYYNLSEEILKEFIKQAKTINSTVLFVQIPWQHDCNLDLLDKHSIELFHKICDEQDILCANPFDKIKLFLETEPNPETHCSCHFSPEVNKIISDEIIKVLKTEGLLYVSSKIK